MAFGMRASQALRLPASNHDRDPFRRTGQRGIEPAVAVFPEREALVEQHHVVPLRPLGLVHRQGVAVIELVGIAPRRRRQLVVPPFEEGRQDADPDGLAVRLLFRA